MVPCRQLDDVSEQRRRTQPEHVHTCTQTVPVTDRWQINRCVRCSGQSHTYEADRPPQERVEAAASSVDATFSSAELQPGLQAVDDSFNQHDLVGKTNVL